MLVVAWEPSHSQIPVAELGAMNSLVAVEMFEKRTASLSVTLAVVALFEPRVLDVGTVSDSALEPMNLVDGHALEADYPMIVGA